MATGKGWRNPSKNEYMDRYQVNNAIHLQRLKEYFRPDYHQIIKFNSNGQTFLRHGSPLGTTGE